MYSVFSRILLNWYEKHKRDLPWRRTSDAYRIWISEVILQQTRVAQGWNYYVEFIKKFPTLEILANAQEQEILKAWEGLGYYSRARNIHLSARLIVEQRAGIFPENYRSLLKLKGIGPYTAAAIASICFKEAVPAIDGNAFRVFARYFGIKTNISSNKASSEFFELGLKVISKDKPGDFNQAVMELGALICSVKNPKCFLCPLKSSCFALVKKQLDLLPIKEKKNYNQERFFYYLHLSSSKGTWIKKRIKKDIWKGLYELPLIESSKELPKDQVMKAFFDEFNVPSAFVESISQKLTHRRLKIEFWQATPPSGHWKRPKGTSFVQTKSFDLYPLVHPVKVFLNKKECV